MAMARPEWEATCASRCNRHCVRWPKARDIRDCIYGENWRKSDERSWALLKQMPELKADGDLGRGNKGMTLILL